MVLSGVTFSSLIDAWSKRGEIRSVEETFEKMKPADVVPNVTTSNKVRDGVEIFETVREGGMVLSGVTFSSLVDACTKHGETKNAEQAC